MKLIELERKWPICVFDIETTDLRADYGYVTTVCIYDYLKKKMFTYRIDDKRNPDKKNDRWVVEQAINKLNEFEVHVDYNGSMFDKPFLHTRSLLTGLDMLIKPCYNRDLLYPARHKFRLSSRRLQYVERILFNVTTKTFTTPALKNAIIRGEKYALDFTVNHCRKDVLSTARLYTKFMPYLTNNLKRK